MVASFTLPLRASSLLYLGARLKRKTVARWKEFKGKSHRRFGSWLKVRGVLNLNISYLSLSLLIDIYRYIYIHIYIYRYIYIYIHMYMCPFHSRTFSRKDRSFFSPFRWNRPSQCCPRRAIGVEHPKYFLFFVCLVALRLGDFLDGFHFKPLGKYIYIYISFQKPPNIRKSKNNWVVVVVSNILIFNLTWGDETTN